MIEAIEEVLQDNPIVAHYIVGGIDVIYFTDIDTGFVRRSEFTESFDFTDRWDSRTETHYTDDGPLTLFQDGTPVWNETEGRL